MTEHVSFHPDGSTLGHHRVGSHPNAPSFVRLKTLVHRGRILSACTPSGQSPLQAKNIPPCLSKSLGTKIISASRARLLSQTQIGSLTPEEIDIWPERVCPTSDCDGNCHFCQGSERTMRNCPSKSRLSIEREFAVTSIARPKSR